MAAPSHKTLTVHLDGNVNACFPAYSHDTKAPVYMQSGEEDLLKRVDIFHHRQMSIPASFSHNGEHLGHVI